MAGRSKAIFLSHFILNSDSSENFVKRYSIGSSRAGNENAVNVLGTSQVDFGVGSGQLP